jgi:hypothetical protein
MNDTHEMVHTGSVLRYLHPNARCSSLMSGLIVVKKKIGLR